jgi:hypothetical protein
VKSKDNKSLGKDATEALERFENRNPFLVWIEANAIHVVRSKPPLDSASLHEVLNAWEKDLQMLLQLSSDYTMHNASMSKPELAAWLRRAP